MQWILRHLDRLFNRAFSSDYNPIYRTGTIAIGLLTIIMVTGLYLCLFYRLGTPYESIRDLQGSIWLGRWIRALHRYASDAMVVTVILHIFRMIAQGKTWGPRTLAWISGVILLWCTFISAWTGYVMVWDEQGQSLAIAGARILDSMGIFADSIGRSFNGQTNAPASFFFLNLFLHIVVPLAMIFGIWIHTSKLANTIWFPQHQIFKAMIGLLIFLSLIFPAPLDDAADLLRLPDRFSLDWLYNFWLPWGQSHPREVLWAFVIFTLFLSSIPWWLRPRVSQQAPKSVNDDRNCQGCTQCTKDCPYEAITMVPRQVGKGSELVALVNPDLCVACGLCSASCAPFTMGPPGRKGSDQLMNVRRFVSELRKGPLLPKDMKLILACQLQAGSFSYINEKVAKDPNIQIFGVECAGTIHASSLDYLAANFKEVVIASCPERNCQSKDGYTLLKERISGEREPYLKDSFRDRVQVQEVGDGEEYKVLAGLKGTGRARTISSLFGGLLILALIAMSSHFEVGSASHEGILRISVRLSGQVAKICRDRTDQELAMIPQHMRTAQECTVRMLAYQFYLSVDGKTLTQLAIRPGGLHHDRPVYVDYEIPMAANEHEVSIQLRPIGTESEVAGAVSLNFEENVKIQAGRVHLLTQSADQKGLQLIQGSENE